MKHILTALTLCALALTLASCGPASMQYDCTCHRYCDGSLYDAEVYGPICTSSRDSAEARAHEACGMWVDAACISYGHCACVCTMVDDDC